MDVKPQQANFIIEYDKFQNKKAVFQMWQDVFADPERFAQYYFKEWYGKNQVLLAWKENQLAGMLHLNPYIFHVGGETVNIDYIVGVATKPAYRRQGIMRQLLCHALWDMAREEKPFTFLMPANKAYYEPFGFRFIYDTCTIEYEPLNKQEENGKYQIAGLTDCRVKELAEISNRILKEQYQVFPLRTMDYIRRLQKELNSQDGDIIVLQKNQNIVGYFSYTREDGSIWIDQLVTKEPVSECIACIRNYLKEDRLKITLSQKLINTQEAKPAIMARILRADKLFPMLKTTKDVDMVIEIKDPILSQNNGIFHWKAKPDNGKGVFERCNQEPDISITIEALTQCIFGYRGKNQSDISALIQPLEKIFIQEVV